MCLVVTCWERADLLALVCGVQLWVCHFPIGILGHVWYLIVSIPDLCTPTNFHSTLRFKSLPSSCEGNQVYLLLWKRFLRHACPNPCYQWLWYQGFLPTAHFPKFGCVVNSRKEVFVMLMPSHSQCVTFGYIKFHLPLWLPPILSWWGLLARSNNPEVNVYSYTGHSRLRTGEQKTWCYLADHLWRWGTGPDLGPIPGVYWIALGLES